VNETLELLAVRLACEGYLVQFELLRDAPKHWIWHCTLRNEILGSFPEGTGESLLLALERAIGSRNYMVETRKGMS
jgi:hypothetical protein